jgi:hypothetical protein
MGLERKIHRNQELRVKHGDDPSKFMESEIELFEEINKLQAVATAPELYVEFVKINGVARVSRATPKPSLPASCPSLVLNPPFSPLSLPPSAACRLRIAP